MLIEVDENGTLDLSMKKCKENVKSQTKTPLDDPLSPSESTMAKGGSVLISPAFYQPLCERDSWESPIPINFSKQHVLQDAEVKKINTDNWHFRWNLKTWDVNGDGWLCYGVQSVVRYHVCKQVISVIHKCKWNDDIQHHSDRVKVKVPQDPFF